MECYMAAESHLSIASMDVHELIALRNDVNRVLGQKSESLKQQLRQLEAIAGKSVSRRQTTGRRRSLRGIKVPPKYRDPKNPSLVWAGRGALPRWMQDQIKKGAKRDDFIIAKANGKAPSARKRAKKASVTRATRKSTRKAA
jgi:DNA-binding protein H-NS